MLDNYLILLGQTLGLKIFKHKKTYDPNVFILLSKNRKVLRKLFDLVVSLLNSSS